MQFCANGLPTNSAGSRGQLANVESVGFHPELSRIGA
jgi:hypothetical protein